MRVMSASITNRSKKYIKAQHNRSLFRACAHVRSLSYSHSLCSFFRYTETLLRKTAMRPPKIPPTQEHVGVSCLDPGFSILSPHHPLCFMVMYTQPEEEKSTSMGFRRLVSDLTQMVTQLLCAPK